MQYSNRPSELYAELATPIEIERETTHLLHGYTVREACHPTGHTHTIHTGDILHMPPSARLELTRAAGEVLRWYLGDARRILVCGLGNEKMAADRLGSAVCAKLGLCGSLPNGLSLYSFTPGTAAATGIPTEMLVRLAAQTVDAQCILAIDALCARHAHHLTRVIQWTDTGITPGSGVSEGSGTGNTNSTGNDSADHSPEISTRTMPCPVVTAGVPTAIRTTLPLDNEENAADTSGRTDEKYLVTPGHIDRAVECWSSVLSAATMQAVLHHGRD